MSDSPAIAMNTQLRPPKVITSGQGVPDPSGGEFAQPAQFLLGRPNTAASTPQVGFSLSPFSTAPPPQVPGIPPGPPNGVPNPPPQQPGPANPPPKPPGPANPPPQQPPIPGVPPQGTGPNPGV